MRLSDSADAPAKAHRRLGRRRAFRIGERPDRDVTGIEHHHQQPRQKSGEKHLNDGNVRLHGVDHHGDRRRDENAERAGAGQRTQTQVFVIAALLQFRQRNLGNRGAGRGRRSRHRTEHAAGKHVDMHEPARQPVQPGRKSTKHFLRQPRAEQDFAHPDEERQGRQRPRRAVAPHRCRQHAARRNGAAGELHAGPSRRHQGDGDPDAATEQQRKKSEQDRGDGEKLHVRPRSAWRVRRLPRRSAASAIRSAARSRAGHGPAHRQKR